MSFATINHKPSRSLDHSAAHARDITACLKITLEADKINVAVTRLDQPSTTPTVSVGVAVNGVTPAQVAAELVMSGDWCKVLECDDAATMSTAESSLSPCSTQYPHLPG